ncbi:MAG TPA: PepSY-associated TM helix domain-containing protein, partial [Flavobacterium sp.]|nr:PepSY-associated TM helix domain-containing protein [Flavobacterium sp.]
MANKNKGYTFRKFIRDIHLWLGVGSGLILFLVCLSGTVYTFRHEIEEAVEPAKYRIENPEGNKVAAQQIIDATQQKTKGKVGRISMYDDAAKPYELQVSMSEEDKRGETYYV